MNNEWLRYKGGELFKRVQDFHGVSPLHGKDNMYVVEVITLKQHLHDLAVEEALKQNVDLDQIDSYIEKLKITKFHSTHEFVKALEDKVLIGINAPKITSVEVNRGLSLMLETQRTCKHTIIKPGTKRIFGNKVRVYDAAEGDRP